MLFAEGKESTIITVSESTGSSSWTSGSIQPQELTVKLILSSQRIFHIYKSL